MKIHVTQEDIDYAKILRWQVGGEISKCCPIALACARQIQQFSVIGKDTITIGNKNRKAPKKVSNFVQQFDDGKPVKPFNFILK